MIDTLRESLATQGQIAETSQNALISIYTIEILLVVVVVLLILSLVSQYRILSAFQHVQRYLFEFKEQFKAYQTACPHGVTHTWKRRKRRKKRRKAK